MAFTSLSNIATGGKRLLFSPCIPHCPRNSTPINHQGEGNRYSPDLTSRPNWWPVCCADAQTKGTHYQKRGTTRFFSGRPNATGFMSHANSPCHGIYGFSDWKEIYFKQYYLFPLSFLFLVCTPATRLDFRRLPGPVFDPPRRETLCRDECGLIFPNSGW